MSALSKLLAGQVLSRLDEIERSLSVESSSTPFVPDYSQAMWCPWGDDDYPADWQDVALGSAPGATVGSTMATPFPGGRLMVSLYPTMDNNTPLSRESYVALHADDPDDLIALSGNLGDASYFRVDGIVPADRDFHIVRLNMGLVDGDNQPALYIQSVLVVPELL